MADITPTGVVPASESAPTPAPIPVSTPAPSNPTRGVPLITFDMSEETDSRWGKFVNFCKSTIGKIVLFTILFLGIAYYILTTSNVVLFQGSISRNPDAIIANRSQVDGGVSQTINSLENAEATTPINNKANPFVGENALPAFDNGTATIDPNATATTDATRNGLIATRLPTDLSTTIDRNFTGLTNDQLSDGTIQRPGGSVVATDLPAPGAPSNLTASCLDNAQAVLQWKKVPWFVVAGQTQLTYNIRIGDKVFTQVQEKIDQNLQNPAVYTFAAIPDQKYTWSVSASANGKTSAEVSGSEFACKAGVTATSTTATTSTLTPEQLNALNLLKGSGTATTPTGLPNFNNLNDANNQFLQNLLADNLCPDNQYFVVDSNPAKSACKNIPSYQGAAIQSDFICGLYTTIANDPVTYKINNVTKATLQKGITSQCKSSTQPPVQPPVTQTVCPVDTYLNGGVISADCKPVPTLVGATGENAKLICGQLKTLYGLGASIKMSNQTIDNLLKNINGPVCSPAAPIQSNGQLTITAGGVDATSGTNTTTSETQTNVKPPKTSGSGLVALQNQAAGSVTPSHPVAGKQRPSATSSTGPEMWGYGIAAAMSYYVARRKKLKK